MFTRISYVHLMIAALSAFRLVVDCVADGVATLPAVMAAPSTVTSVAAAAAEPLVAAASVTSSSSDWQPRMIVSNVHPLGTNQLASTNDLLNERAAHHVDASATVYNGYFNDMAAAKRNYTDATEQAHGLGHYVSHQQQQQQQMQSNSNHNHNNNQSYLSFIADAYRQTASSNHNMNNNNHIMSRISVRPLQQNDVATTKPSIFNSQYINTFRSTVVTIFQRVQEFVSYMYNYFTAGE